MQELILSDKDKKVMNLVPLSDRVLVDVIEEQGITDGGIHLPANTRPKPSKGKVIGVGRGRRGPDAKLYPPDVDLNDVVVFDKFSGNKIEHDNKTYLVLREDEVICKITNTTSEDKEDTNVWL